MSMQLPDVPVEEWDQYQSDVFRNDTDQRIASLPLHVAPIRDDWMQPGAFQPPTPSDSLTNPLGSAPAAGDATVPVSPENQSLDAQIRQPLGPAPMYQQHPSSGAADATLDAPAGAQSLGAASEMFPTWSQDARSAVLTSDIPRGPAQGTPVPPANYTNTSVVSDSGAGGPSLPAPDAPLPTDFGTHADTRIASLSTPASPASASSPPAGQATSSTVNGVSGPPDLVAAAMNAADAQGLDPNLYVSLIQQESSFNPRAGSPVGAQGLAQLMPATARGLGVTDPWDPIQSLQGGARFLKQMLDQFGGDVVKALAAYNAGPGAVQKYGGIPPYEETQRYVKQVMGRLSDEPIDTSQITGIPGTYAPGPAEGLARVGSGLEKQQGNALDLARAQLGKPYIWGSAGGRSDFTDAAAGFDCSGFVSYVMKNGFGVDLPAFTGTAYTSTRPLAQGEAPEPGDVVFYNMGQGDPHVQHIALYMGNGKIIQAGGIARNVNIADVNEPVGSAPEIRRPNGLDKAMQNARAQDQVAQAVDPSVDPAGWLGRAKDAIGSSFGGAVQTAADTVSSAASSIFGPQSAGQPAASQPMPSDALTNPLGTGNAPSPPPASSMTPPQPQQSVWDRVGQGISDVFRSAFGAEPAGQPASMQPTPSDTLTNPTLQTRPTDMSLPPAAQPTVFDRVGQAIPGILYGPTGRPPTAEEFAARAAANPMARVQYPDNPLEVLGGASLGAPTSGEEAAAARNEAIARGNPLRDVPVVGGATTFAAQAALDPTNLLLAGPGIGKAAVEGAGAAAEALGSEEVQAALRSRQPAQAQVGFAMGAPATGPKPPAYQSVMPAGAFETPAPPTSGAPLSSQITDARDTVFRNLTRAFTDRQVDINQAQQRYAQALGRPLQADEMAAELQRLSADPAAAVKIDEGLKPAIQAVGDDYAALRDYVTLRSNVQVAEGAGTKVQATAMARDVPSNLRDDLNAANTSLRIRQDALNNLQNASVPDQARVQLAQRSVNAAQRTAQRRQDAIDAWLQANTQAAATEGAQAAQNRLFSGGLNRDQSQQAIQDLQTQLGPDRFQTVQQAADQVSTFSRGLRQRLVDSGVLSQEQADQMDALYPDWAKTRVLDYMADPAGGQGAGTKIGLADRQLRQYTLEGTTKAREDPLASTVAYAHQVERMANKNDAFNAMLKIDQASPKPMLRQVPQDFSPTKNQVTMVGFQNGQKVKYVTDNKALGEAINGTSVMSAPGWISAWQKVFRSLATSRNPVFLAGNAALDIPTYAFRTAIRDGGPQALPGVMADLARGYGDAFQGLLQGEYRGAGTSAFIKGGGGMEASFTGGQAADSAGLIAKLASPKQKVANTAAEQIVQELQRKNVFQIDGKADLLRLAKDLVTLKPVESLGERIELGPRVAAYNRALARGANPVQAVIDGRTVTVDFSQGGTVTKYLNNFVPFLNVGFQGPVQIARAFRDNPRAFVATTGTLIGLPTVVTEVWNRADPQRAKDYADVPDYIKNQGVVFMLPGEAPTDAQGNRKPLYAVLKLREWAPFAAIAREATARALGDNSKTLAEMAQSIGTGFSPTQSSSAGQLASEALSGIPVVPAAAQLGINKDLFRNRDIVTQRNDQNASAAAKTLTPVIQAAVDRLGLNMEVRPSAVDFFIRNQGAGVGGAALGASDIAAGTARQNTSPTSLPGVGGLVGRFVSDQTGQGLQTARGEVLTQSARDILRQNGITSTPGAVGSSANGVPLRLEEEARYQQLANRYVDEAIHRAPANPNWTRMPQSGKQALVDELTSAAKERAAQEVLRSIGGPSEARRRVAARSSR